jgi:hypothetical protein
MSLEKLVSRKLRLALGFGVALSAPLQADLPKIYVFLTERGIVSAQNKTISINNKDVTADLYLDEFSSPIKYPLVVIDEVKNTTEKAAVESIGGKYIVCSDDASKADSIVRLIIGGYVSTVNPVCTKKTGDYQTRSGIFDLTGRKTETVSKNKLYINMNVRTNSYFLKR